MHMHPMMTMRHWMDDHHFMEHHPVIAKLGHALQNPAVWALIALVAFTVLFVSLAAMNSSGPTTYWTYPGMPIPMVR